MGCNIFLDQMAYIIGRAKFWNIVIFSHIVVNWGKIMRKSFVTAHIVQTCAPGTYLNITGWTNQRAEDPKQPIRGQNSIILRWIPGAQDCTMWAVTTHFLFILPQLTTIWLNITMFQNFARPSPRGSTLHYGRCNNTFPLYLAPMNQNMTEYHYVSKFCPL